MLGKTRVGGEIARKFHGSVAYNIGLPEQDIRKLDKFSHGRLRMDPCTHLKVRVGHTRPNSHQAPAQRAFPTGNYAQFFGKCRAT